MSKELKSSFEPENYESMIEDYNILSNKLFNFSKISSAVDISRKTFILISELERRKKAFEKQFESLNIEYTKR